MASVSGGPGGGGENRPQICSFCNGNHDPGRCQLFKSIDTYIFGFHNMRALMLVARAKNDLLLFKGCTKSKEFLEFRAKKLQALRDFKAKLDVRREKLKAFMKAANDIQQCLNIPFANIHQMYMLLGHPKVPITLQPTSHSPDSADPIDYRF